MTQDNRFTAQEQEQFLKEKAERDAAAERWFAEQRRRAAEGKPAILVRRRGWNTKSH